MCNISHISGAYWKTLVQDSGRIWNERFTAGQKTTTETSCFSGREILQLWCSNGRKCQKIFALIGFSVPSVKSFTMPDNGTYKTMAKLRVIQHLSPYLDTGTCYCRWFQESVVDGFLDWNLWILWMSTVHILEVQQNQNDRWWYRSPRCLWSSFHGRLESVVHLLHPES